MHSDVIDTVFRSGDIKNKCIYILYLHVHER